MSGAHNDDAPHPEPQAPSSPAPSNVSARQLKQLRQEVQDAALEARLAKQPGRPR
jgi:hypothetical protein